MPFITDIYKHLKTVLTLNVMAKYRNIVYKAVLNLTNLAL